MSYLLSVLTIMCLGQIAYQDFRERQAYWFLFPLAMILFGSLHYSNSVESSLFLNYVMFNMLLVTLIVVALYAYTRFVAKKRFLNHSLGLGDILFFFAFALGFPTITFIILFANAIVFSLLTYLFLKKVYLGETVPLAGLMGLFLIAVIGYGIIFKSPSLYAY
ncbi:general secretion pathway protein [Muricauda sp. JGD-17]|uniref:General secretion pathway protein n=1 Tax=Flagellimonas ochracea TaxID=2696472 RepID=A0A964TEJ3_9FLAO|nr:general secretion pathway protein [Allomuricauda ochracea]NAY93495.1 general secretion pathway protein [Allomuricauda ochracea]